VLSSDSFEAWAVAHRHFGTLFLMRGVGNLTPAVQRGGWGCSAVTARKKGTMPSYLLGARNKTQGNVLKPNMEATGYNSNRRRSEEDEPLFVTAASLKKKSSYTIHSIKRWEEGTTRQRSKYIGRMSISYHFQSISTTENDDHSRSRKMSFGKCLNYFGLFGNKRWGRVQAVENFLVAGFVACLAAHAAAAPEVKSD
jgi:hypothetical protein